MSPTTDELLSKILDRCSDTPTRKDLLLKMYDQMFNDINRHILVIWQSVGVLVSAFAIFALVEKKIINLDIATAIIILLSGWLFAHLLDASYWYNRNLCIIANIERVFLHKADLRSIHYYFGAHRQKNKMIIHLRVQLALGIGLSGIVLLYHFISRVLPGLSQPMGNFEPMRSIPYAILAAVIIFLFWLNGHRDESYEEFVKNSPGGEVSVDGIHYGRGHGRKRGSEGT